MIQIDMPMPESCYDCPLNYDFCWCLGLSSEDWKKYEDDWHLQVREAENRPGYCPLKEQETKLLTFEEVKKHYSIPGELLRDIHEYVDFANDIEPLYLECPDDDGFVVHWRIYDSIAMRLDDWKKDYGKTWRCWTTKPTLEQSLAVKWE